MFLKIHKIWILEHWLVTTQLRGKFKLSLLKINDLMLTLRETDDKKVIDCNKTDFLIQQVLLLFLIVVANGIFSKQMIYSS